MRRFPDFPKPNPAVVASGALRGAHCMRVGDEASRRTRCGDRPTHAGGGMAAIVGVPQRGGRPSRFQTMHRAHAGYFRRRRHSQQSGHSIAAIRASRPFAARPRDSRARDACSRPSASCDPAAIRGASAESAPDRCDFGRSRRVWRHVGRLALAFASPPRIRP